MKKVLPLGAMLTLGACAQAVEGRIASRLVEAGLSRPMASCMAEHWSERLSIAQLRKLSNAAGDLKKERKEGKLSVSEVLARVRQMNDPEIVEVVTKSSVVCALTS